MARADQPTAHVRWAQLKFSVVGPLLSSPPAPGDLRWAIERLSATDWVHPITGKPARFGFSTIERWYYQAKKAEADPVGALRRRVRRDSGDRRAMSESLKAAVLVQYKRHVTWSTQLHFDNLVALASTDESLRPMPSYSTLLRYMKASGLWKRRRLSSRDTDAARRSQARLEAREVRSFEVEHVDGLWHLDFHKCSRQVVTPGGERVTPVLLGVLDDRSRLACHLQWYLAETAENLVHGVCQAFQKRRLPRALMTDNGPAMLALEVVRGLADLGVLHETTLDYSPYQNGKQERFWALVEGRLLAMLEGVPELTLSLLNQATQSWVELDYNHQKHRETGEPPLTRYLAGPEVGRTSPSSDRLRQVFTAIGSRAQRRGDGTVSIEGKRFEIPSRYRHLARVTVRYARWDLSFVYLVDAKTDAVLCRIYPLDRAANATGERRILAPGPTAATDLDPGSPPTSGVAPLLSELMARYAATGLPPAYLPKEE